MGTILAFFKSVCNVPWSNEAWDTVVDMSEIFVATVLNSLVIYSSCLHALWKFRFYSLDIPFL